MINNRQGGRRRGRGGQQARNGQPGGPNGGSRLDNRARGNAAQLLEKYKTLARDAQMQGDRVNTEYYLQFADHYFRVLAETRSRFEEQRPRQQAEYRDEFGDGGDGETVTEARGREGEDVGDGWEEGEQPQRESRPRREEREPREDRPERQERQERRERPQRNGAAKAAPTEVGELAADALPPRIQVDRIPPALAENGEADVVEAAEPAEEAPRPRRRPRRPRETVTAEA